MRRALRLARKAQGNTSPNPMVGALLVKGSAIVAQGYHKKAGLAHAEIVALTHAPRNIKGSTLYVNLEPCCHFGRTPPCVDEIIKSGIRRVVVATVDPNPIVSGRSLKKLRGEGIKVTCGVLAAHARRLNEIFFKNMRTNLPFVAAKAAQSLDGKIATFTGESKWITCPLSRTHARRLRDEYDCVLVGLTTVLKDNPHLNGLKKIPYKVVLDPLLEIPAHCNILKETAQRVIIFASHGARHKKTKIPGQARIFFVNERHGNLALGEILRKLYSLGICSVFVEGGSYTLGSFLQARLIDKMYLFIAPKIIGGAGALASFGAQGFPRLAQAPAVREASITRIGQDFLITGYPDYGISGGARA